MEFQHALWVKMYKWEGYTIGGVSFLAEWFERLQALAFIVVLV